MSAYKPPRSFFKPLGIGAPEPFRELPVRVERMIHFVPPHLEKVRAKVPQMAKTADVILANKCDLLSKEQRAKLWDTVQAFCSSVTGALAQLAVLKGVGVGSDAVRRGPRGEDVGRG